MILRSTRLLPVVLLLGLLTADVQAQIARTVPSFRPWRASVADRPHGAAALRAAPGDTTLKFYLDPGEWGPPDQLGSLFVMGDSILVEDETSGDEILIGIPLSLHVAFEAPVSGTLALLSFPLYEDNTIPGISGTGTLRVKLSLLDDVDFDVHPVDAPGTDSIDIPFADLSATDDLSFSNYIDLSAASFDLVEGELYSLAFILVDGSDEAGLTFVVDPGSVDDTDDRYYPDFFGGEGARTGTYLSEGIDGDGIYQFGFHNNFLVDLAIRAAPGTAIEPDRAGIPSAFRLAQNYPNPFNPSTSIAFDLPAAAYTTLEVFDLVGRRVATLVAAELQAGAYTLPFDAVALPSGPYLYRLRSGPYTEQRLLMLVR